MIFRALLSIASTFVLGACATHEVTPTGLDLMSETEYQKVIDRNTEHNQQYKGLYNTMDITATLVSPVVAMAQLEQKARLYQWDRAKFQGETNKLNEELKNQTIVFMSFFTPERKNDDLHKSSSQWRVYLESAGRRWEGKVTKIKTAVAEIQGLYPYHTRFSTPYQVTFTTSAVAVSAENSRFLVTGPIGLMGLAFKSTSHLPAE